MQSNQAQVEAPLESSTAVFVSQQREIPLMTKPELFFCANIPTGINYDFLFHVREKTLGGVAGAKSAFSSSNLFFSSLAMHENRV